MAMAGMTVDLSFSLTSFVWLAVYASVCVLVSFSYSHFSFCQLGSRFTPLFCVPEWLVLSFSSSALVVFIEPIRGLRHCLRTGYVVFSVNFPLHSS